MAYALLRHLALLLAILLCYRGDCMVPAADLGVGETEAEKEITAMSTSRNNGSTRKDKRARFAASSGKNGRQVAPALWIVGALVLLGVFGGLLIALTRGGPATATAATPGGAADGAGNAVGGAIFAATSGHAPYPEAKAENGAIRLPVADFADGKARYYTYMDNGRPIEFFVVQDSGGEIRVAFNACDVCFGARKGYRQEGDVMICNNCGRRFPTDQVGLVAGGCNPSPLPFQVEGATLVLRVQDLAAGGGFFSF